ncbi:hypothetical protein BHM03_00025656 [Ensete ventricosum]|nr:hypothetical protein BHM03_00025656 [Ensete ventricosum]
MSDGARPPKNVRSDATRHVIVLSYAQSIGTWTRSRRSSISRRRSSERAPQLGPPSSKKSKINRSLLTFASQC